MPPVRTTRTRSSTSVVSDVSSTSKDDLATVPPFKDSKSRIEWACNLRGVDPSSFITKGTSVRSIYPLKRRASHSIHSVRKTAFPPLVSTLSRKRGRRPKDATGREPPATSDNVHDVTTVQPSSATTPSTTLFYGLSAPHATLRPASLDTDMLLSALRQPVLTIRHTEYGLLPPPFFGSDPLFCLGPTAAGFDSDLETLSGGPPGWDWLIDSWA
ncbi:hypothetical protein EIP86_005067 [Pleurotus ostreatoroseus]|nr:hypothetical protein EIP86_005067 [Pleurotus ostreatoroseus]